MSEEVTMNRPELIMDVEQDEDGMWCAGGQGVCVFTQAATLEELRFNIREAVELHYEDEPLENRPIRVRLRVVQEEFLTT